MSIVPEQCYSDHAISLKLVRGSTNICGRCDDATGGKGSNREYLHSNADSRGGGGAETTPGVNFKELF